MLARCVRGPALPALPSPPPSLSPARAARSGAGGASHSPWRSRHAHTPPASRKRPPASHNPCAAGAARRRALSGGRCKLATACRRLPRPVVQPTQCEWRSGYSGAAPSPACAIISHCVLQNRTSGSPPGQAGGRRQPCRGAAAAHEAEPSRLHDCPAGRAGWLQGCPPHGCASRCNAPKTGGAAPLGRQSTLTV